MLEWELVEAVPDPVPQETSNGTKNDGSEAERGDDE